jgi:hypothetical protein
MSVRSLTVLAAARDTGVPMSATRKAKPDDAAAVDAGPRGESAATAGDAVVAAIPTEALALYTGLVSGVVALIADGTKAAEQYVPLRWWLYGVTCAFIAVWVVGGYYSLGKKGAGRRRIFPFAEVLTATTAFGAWGLVMPESPLRTQLDGTTEGVTTLCITFGAAALVYLMAQFGLTKKVKR